MDSIVLAKRVSNLHKIGRQASEVKRRIHVYFEIPHEVHASKKKEHKRLRKKIPVKKKSNTKLYAKLISSPSRYSHEKREPHICRSFECVCCYEAAYAGRRMDSPSLFGFVEVEDCPGRILFGLFERLARGFQPIAYIVEPFHRLRGIKKAHQGSVGQSLLVSCKPPLRKI